METGPKSQSMVCGGSISCRWDMYRSGAGHVHVFLSRHGRLPRHVSRPGRCGVRTTNNERGISEVGCRRHGGRTIS